MINALVKGIKATMKLKLMVFVVLVRLPASLSPDKSKAFHNIFMRNQAVVAFVLQGLTDERSTITTSVLITQHLRL